MREIEVPIVSVYCCVLEVLMNGSFKPDTRQDTRTETESERESGIIKPHPLISCLRRTALLYEKT